MVSPESPLTRNARFFALTPPKRVTDLSRRDADYTSARNINLLEPELFSVAKGIFI
jgi:hypothetical protein